MSDRGEDGVYKKDFGWGRSEDKGSTVPLVRVVPPSLEAQRFRLPIKGKGSV